MNKKRFLLAAMTLIATISFAQTRENSNPYAIFGGEPRIIGEQYDQNSVFVVDNFVEGSPVARIEHNPRTGQVRFFDAKGNFVDNIQLGPRDYGWGVPDPKAGKRYPISPYAYCSNNPISRIDPDGKDDFIFNEKGEFVRIDETKRRDVIVHQTYDGDGNLMNNYIQFADRRHDTKAIRSGEINRLVFVSEEQIQGIMDNAGAFNAQNRANEWSYMNDNSKGNEPLDFSYGAIQSLDPAVSKNPLTNPSPMLFVPEGDGYAHNHMNFGNFLWGVAGHSLGFGKVTLGGAAHANSLFNPRTNGYLPQFDSRDDQLSIRRGANYSKTHGYRSITTY